MISLFSCPSTLAQRTARASQALATGTEALKSGNLDTAEKIFTAALRQGQRSVAIFHNLGIIAQQRNRQQLAVTRFREALRLQPDYAPARLLLGSSLLALGKKEEAIAELKRAVALLPDEPQARLQLARAYEATDDWLGAIEEYQQLSKQSPQEAEYAYRLGRALSRLSEWSYKRIAQLDVKSARLQQSLGQEFLIQGQYGRALAAYQQAARLDPELPEIHLAQALILLELKRFDEALAAIELELRLVPESKAALEAKQKIIAAKNGK